MTPDPVPMSLQGEVAIAGIGTLGTGRFEGLSRSAMVSRALQEALDDSGMDRSDIDGLAVHIGSPRGSDYDEIATLMGLDLSFATQTWSHGRFCGTIVIQAALAIGAGLADVVACVGAFRNSDFARPGLPGFPGFDENFRDAAGPHSETPHAGLLAPIGGAAMAYARYAHLHDLAADALAPVAQAARAHAGLNPGAIARDPLAPDAYTRSPFICEPLRRADCSIPTSTATVILLTSAARARTLRQKPVYLKGFQGLAGGSNEFVFGFPGLGIGQRDVFDPVEKTDPDPVFKRAGISPSEIDALYCYDGFSPQILWTLERFGFVAPGRAAAWVRDGRIGPGGDLPVNSNGGHLAEGHSNGWGQTVELVRQLRGDAGPRQIRAIHTALWATTFGDAVLYAN